MALADALFDIDRFRDETAQLIDRAQKATDTELQQVATILAPFATSLAGLSNIVKAILVGAQSIEDKGAADVRGMIEGLDGWTAEVHAEIRLTKPTPKEMP
jgi:hypothetical protein